MQEATAKVLVNRLRRELTGGVFAAADAAYREVLRGFNLAVEHRPNVAVLVDSVADVERTVRAAAEFGSDVHVVGGGHGALHGIDGGVALLTRDLRGVTIDPTTRTARVLAGLQWSDVIDAAALSGLAPLAGSSPRVGVVGYVLGGGLGPVARTFGFAADHVRSIELVDGSGRRRVTSPTEDAELFWALCGGKTGFGVVTAITLDLVEIRWLYAGGLYFRAADATEALHGWLDWASTVPESVTTSAALLRLPPDPALPEPLRGQTVLHVRAAHVGDPEVGAALVQPLRGLGSPLLDTLGVMRYADLAAIHSDPVEPMPYTDAGSLLSGLDHDGVDQLLEVAGADCAVPLAAVELRLLGGALARPPAVPNAVAGRDAAFSFFVIGAPVPELLDTVVPATIRRTLQAVGPWSMRTQPNFIGSTNTPEERASSWTPEVAARLDAVRRDVDPAGLFRPSSGA